MAFVLKQSPTFTWPVKVAFPIDGGKYRHETFDAEFRRIGQSEVQALAEKVTSGETSAEDVIRDILVGWSGITDEDGADLPFSVKARDELLEVALVAGATLNAFLDAYAGGNAKRKN